MRSRPILRLLVCAMTVLCPVFCLHAAAHAAEHAADAAFDGCHGHANSGQPHHHHAPDGEPVPVREHACICSAAAPGASATQIPSLEMSGAILAQALLLEQRLGRAVSPLVDFDASPGLADSCLPLLV